jgi:hypothetical protein
LGTKNDKSKASVTIAAILLPRGQVLSIFMKSQGLAEPGLAGGVLNSE